MLPADGNSDAFKKNLVCSLESFTCWEKTIVEKRLHYFVKWKSAVSFEQCALSIVP